jgi:hypothetical protein
VGHVIRMGEMRNVYNILVGSMRGKIVGRSSIDGITLKWVLRK